MALRVFRQTKSGDEIIQLAVRLGLLAFLLYWSFVLVRPFIPILAWSMVLTVALYPPYDWLSVHLGGRPKLAAAIITVINLVIIIGPVTWLGLRPDRWPASSCGPARRGHLGHSVPAGGRQGLADRRRADLQPLGPGLDKSRGCVARGSPAPEAIGRPGARLCRQRRRRNAQVHSVRGAVRFPVPLWPAAGRGHKTNSGAPCDATKRGFCCAGRADDTHGVARRHRRCRRFKRCWPVLA